MAPVTELIRTTCPRDCYDACGIIVVKTGGVIDRVKGDPDHPVARGTLCPKCTLAYNAEWRDSAARLTQPLRRIGPKGEGRFEPVSWDEALDMIAGRLRPILAESGGETIIQTHYTGTFSMIGSAFPLRFFHRIGATEVDPDTVCNKAGHAALEAIFGSSMDGFDPRTARDAACILVWGANPSAAAPHAHKHWLAEAPGRVIVIDPIRHPTADAADLHLQPFPGTDAALAFALLHVIRREGLLAQEFLDGHVAGWDDVLPSLDACTPAWGEAETGVPAALIEEAAVLYGRGPSLLWLGQGLQRQRAGAAVFRACSLLPIATGNLGKPGAGFLCLNGTDSRGIDPAFLPAPHLNPHRPPPISHMDLAERLEDPHRSRALFCWNNNIAASSPRQARLRRALAREDLFTVAIDLFPTDTTDYADVVLPAASFLEFDDLVCSYFHYTVSAQVTAAEPVGASLPNQEIFRRLAARMGFTEPDLFESDEAMIAALLRQTGLGLSFAELARRGTVPFQAAPFVPFLGGVFPTPSGKAEITSERFAAAGLPRVPRPDVQPRPTAGRLRVLPPASPWLMNSSYGNVATVRAQAGPADVCLHPEEARRRGLGAGDPVLLRNEAGELRLQVSPSDRVPPGVALVHKGRWPKLDPGGANANVLNGGERADMAGSSSVHSVEADLVPLARAEGSLP